MQLSHAPGTRHARRSRSARPALRRNTHSVHLGVEALEHRIVPSDVFRSINGADNNLIHANWAAAGADLIRISPVAYADGISTPSQPNTLSAREISNNLNNQSDPIFSGLDNLGAAQSRDLSDFAYVWGQFIDHDMDLTPTGSGQLFNIPPDPTRPADLMGVEPFTRSTFDPATGTSKSNPRQQVNVNTSYLDLSQVYGSSQVVADALRTFHGGLMKTSPGGFLPYDNTTYFTPAQITALNMANDAMQVPQSSLFAAGDVRANENIELTAVQTLFVRNHNRLAEQLHDLHPQWNDEQLYQEARKLNIATEEMITYNEFLPAILGPNALPAYTGYKDNVNASIATEFSTVGYRFGHSLLSNSVGRVNNNGTYINDPTGNAAVNLAQDFFDPNLIGPNRLVDPLTGHVSTGIGAILKADASNTANETDLLLIDEIRNLLFGIPNAPGTDLAARDVQRARDDGIGTYNQVRVAYGLPAVKTFADITSNVTVQHELQATYGTVDKIDPFEGMLAEDHLPGADVGPTIKAILVKQFTALRDGDHFFYLNERFTNQEVKLIEQAPTLAQLIEHNTPITNLQSNVFYFKVSITGTVLDTDTHNGARGLAGVTVNLNDDSGTVVATTTTDSHGRYSFTDQTGIPGTGKFSVSIVLPLGFVHTSASSIPLAISRGNLKFEGMNFGVEETGGQAMVVSPGGGGSSNAILVTALLPSSGATATTPTTTPAGNSSTNRTGEAAPSQGDVRAPAASPVTGAANSMASVTSKSPSGSIDQFWIALGSDLSDPLALSLP
jgi:peroxidase